jgi:hypothetical protein
VLRIALAGVLVVAVCLVFASSTIVLADRARTGNITFGSFTVAPVYGVGTGQVLSVHISCRINNLDPKMDSAGLMLRVFRGGVQVDSAQLATVTSPEKGTFGLKYDYVPLAGWDIDTYEFRLDLTYKGSLLATSPTRTLQIQALTPPTRIDPKPGLLVVALFALAAGLGIRYARRHGKAAQATAK